MPTQEEQEKQARKDGKIIARVTQGSSVTGPNIQDIELKA